MFEYMTGLGIAAPSHFLLKTIYGNNIRLKINILEKVELKKLVT